MFLLRHAAAMFVSIQSSLNLGETLLRIAHEWKTAETWFLVRLFILQSSFISQILEFIYWTVTIFIFDHVTDENREYPSFWLAVDFFFQDKNDLF